MEEVTKKKQLTEEEVKELKELLQAYHDCTLKIGEVELNIDRARLTKDNLSIEKSELKNKYKGIVVGEKVLIERLNTKYGKGRIITTDWTYELA